MQKIKTERVRRGFADTLTKFPKERIELPSAYQKIFDEYYLANREGSTRATSASSKLEEWMHRKVASTEMGGGSVHLK